MGMSMIVTRGTDRTGTRASAERIDALQQCTDVVVGFSANAIF
jgi:hypothetical protein